MLIKWGPLLKGFSDEEERRCRAAQLSFMWCLTEIRLASSDSQKLFFFSPLCFSFRGWKTPVLSLIPDSRFVFVPGGGFVSVRFSCKRERLTSSSLRSPHSSLLLFIFLSHLVLDVDKLLSCTAVKETADPSRPLPQLLMHSRGSRKGQRSEDTAESSFLAFILKDALIFIALFCFCGWVPGGQVTNSPELKRV